MNSPEAKQIIDEIVHGTFVREGTMVAAGLNFPKVTVPVPADESWVRALDVSSDGIVYGGTSGRACHLFVGMYGGVTGIVVDMGVVEGADSCAAMCCGEEKFVACVNGKSGGRIIMRQLQELPFDCIQEWQISRKPYEDLSEVVAGERIVHAVRDDERKIVVGATDGHLFLVDIDSAKIEIVGEVAGAGRLAVASGGNIFGFDEADSLWRFDLKKKELVRKAVALPAGNWQGSQLVWGRDVVGGKLYTADGDGNLFSFIEKEGFSEKLGRTRFAEISCMAVTYDGRVFGFCGEGISNMFCYNPDSGEVKDLGAAVSVLERRRYGYVFGDAVTGRDGQIFFGENDDLGHLWIYFPSIRQVTNDES